MKPFSLDIRGRLIEFDRPAVMAIVNITPDSFYQVSRHTDESDIRRAVGQAISEGADIIDLGACSTRPGSVPIDEKEELRRLDLGLRVVRDLSPNIPVSVDTFRASVARRCIADFGADIINDISGGDLDPDMFPTVAGLRVPYILTHLRGTPQTMQSLTDYPDGVTAGVIREIYPKFNRLRSLGVSDIIIDPGFGFAKTLQQNYRLLRDLAELQIFGVPVLAGLSRKSMVTNLLDINPDEALPATSVLNSLAILGQAAILRVHDVREARQTIEILSALNNT